jgi:hypothetical protein
MPTPTLTIDTTKFVQATQYVFDNTRKIIPEILNRGALVSLIGGKGVQGAMKRTPKALRDVILAVPVASVAKYVLARHRGVHLTRAQITTLVKKEYRRRIAAIGYTANTGWNKAIIALGGRGIGKHATGKGYASLGGAKPSIGTDFTVEFWNTTPAAQMIGTEPLQAALDDTARDMVEYAGGKLEEVFTSASG